MRTQRLWRLCNEIKPNKFIGNTTLSAIKHALYYTPKQHLSTTSTSLKINFVTSGPRRYTNKMQFLEPRVATPIPVYEVLKPDGRITHQHQDPQLRKEMMMKMYATMVQQNEMDKIMYNAQRQGRVSFYMTSYGEEATQVGSAAALNELDLVFGQYREAGVLAWRGFRLDQFMDQLYANKNDPALGRQMPLHYGSKELNFVTISSPLATQMPQAVGAAYSLKRSNPGTCVICYFGEGAASEGDAHAAFNFAATLDAPCLFFCRNNGYAISTPANEQYRGDGIAARGAGYGMLAIRVDGNDIFAVYNATRRARQIAVEENRPVLIEAMTYRVGHHSTSDDSSTYRTKEEVAYWKDNYDPIQRIKNYLINTRGLWSEKENKQLITDTRKKILTEFGKAEMRLKPSPRSMFTDVYDEMTDHLKRQNAEMNSHLVTYSGKYPLDRYEPFN